MRYLILFLKFIDVGKLLSEEMFQHEAFNSNFSNSKKINDFLSDWKKSTAKMYEPYLLKFFSFLENYCNLVKDQFIFLDVNLHNDSVSKIHAIVSRYVK